MDPRTELESFKRDIKLHEYAASVGYALDQQETSRREMIMRSGADKVSIRRDTDGHYVYYSFRDHNDNGTILDFVKRRQNKSLGEIRQALRLWLGRDLQMTLPVFEHLMEAPRANRAKVAAAVSAMKDLRWHEYLEKERCLPRPVLTGPRFKGRVKVDARSNAAFPHYDNGVLCGYELRNKTFKGFAAEGEKGLWLSNQFPDDMRLVISESAIDGLSHHVLFGDDYTRYASIAGGLNPVQPELLAQECGALPPSSEIICITHADKDGDRYADVIRDAVTGLGRSDLVFRVHRPEVVKDWNDELRRQNLFPAALGEQPRLLEPGFQ